MFRSYFKRIFDLIFSIVLIIVLTPIMVLVALLLMFSFKGKALFIQERPGKDNKIFRVIKFKTMNDKRNDLGELLPDNLRVTKIGSIVRATSLDELPQLFNVVKGDMSFVGPRPLLKKYLPLYTAEQIRRHNVRPGITGLAQVSGRNNISWDKKFELDVYYVENITFKLDVKILLQTLLTVVSKKDINKSGFVTTDTFTGNN